PLLDPVLVPAGDAELRLEQGEVRPQVVTGGDDRPEPVDQVPGKLELASRDRDLDGLGCGLAGRLVVDAHALDDRNDLVAGPAGLLEVARGTGDHGPRGEV